MSGTLYLCATPIGNLSDVSERCIEIFKSVDLIAAEDTRRTLGLLNHLNISKPLTSYHEHNKKEKGVYITNLLKENKNIALVSDAGTPAISDPGEDLVKMCIEENLTVTSIPGAVAAINALILSGISTGRFAFEGFLSVNNRHRHEHLESLKYDTHTLIFYEAPHKLKYTLNDMLTYFGGERKIALVRELTKIHEEVLRMTLNEAIAYYEEKSPRGEYVIIVEGYSEPKDAPKWWSDMDYTAHVKKYVSDGFSEKDAIKQAAKDRNIPKREIYNEYMRK